MATKKQPIIRQLSEGSPLQTLLLEACPPSKEGVKSITVLAEKMNLSSQTIYNWISKGRIPQDRVNSIVKLARGRVTLEMIIPFVVR